ncbi:MAG: diguanylate cyclase [Desulfobulbaceae bacterium]|nr:diguanylate cyclase [Desulfobulbaceae bacterium]
MASEPCTISDNNTPLQITVTISLGTATSGQPNDVGMQDLLKQADNALYHAKSTGRNRPRRLTLPVPSKQCRTRAAAQPFLSALPPDSTHISACQDNTRQSF